MLYYSYIPNPDSKIYNENDLNSQEVNTVTIFRLNVPDHSTVSYIVQHLHLPKTQLSLPLWSKTTPPAVSPMLTHVTVSPACSGIRSVDQVALELTERSACI